MTTNYLNFAKAGTVSIWVGEFASRAEFDNYLEETIDGDSDADAPINRFAGDIGVGFYDHDSQEAEFKGESLPIKDLLTGFWFADSYLENAAAAAALVGIERANAAVLLFDFDFNRNLQANSASPLGFVGAFEFNQEPAVEIKI